MMTIDVITKNHASRLIFEENFRENPLSSCAQSFRRSVLFQQFNCIFTQLVKMTSSKIDVLMVGTGEYTTGYVGGTAADSDKGAGVVALTMFDLRRRGKVDRVGMCGVNVSSLLIE